MLAVYVLLIEGSVLNSARASMLRYRYEMHTFYAMLTVYSWISLIKKVLIFATRSSLANERSTRVLAQIPAMSLLRYVVATSH